MAWIRLTVVLTMVSAFAGVSACASPEEGSGSEGPMPGTWLLTGEAANSVRWGATFKLEQTGGSYSGTFAWKKNDADAGTEAFTGTYDPTTGNITLKGQQATGSVVTATYVAKVAADRTTMTEGQWTSSGTPGTFRAERIGE